MCIFYVFYISQNEQRHSPCQENAVTLFVAMAGVAFGELKCRWLNLAVLHLLLLLAAKRNTNRVTQVMQCNAHANTHRGVSCSL